MKRSFLIACMLVALTAAGYARPERGTPRADVTSNTLRGKTDVHQVANPIAILERIVGLQYQWDTGRGAERDIIALPTEDLATTMPELLEWEIPGQVAAGMRMDRVGVVIIEAVKELVGVLDELCAQVLHLALDLAGLSEDVAEHENRLGLQEEQIQALEQRVSSQEAEITELQKKNEELQRANARQDQAIAKLEAQLAALMAGM